MNSETHTQLFQLRRWFRAGHRITALDALKRFRTLRLAARVLELKRQGLDVRRRLVVKGKRRVAEYWVA